MWRALGPLVNKNFNMEDLHVAQQRQYIVRRTWSEFQSASEIFVMYIWYV